ncbi:MAG: class I SAM-dependent methyltransferase [Chitinophagaceae bacterium]|nr:class I SAM-dependent methyltransferase [Chitinophagaceae bacterium]
MAIGEPSHSSDPQGLHTLELLAAATRFNKWMYDTIRPFCTGHIFEVGSGLGNISRYFLDNKQQLTASDLRPEYCDHIKKQFEGNPFLHAVVSVDLVSKDFAEQYSPLLNQFDTVVALNVIEHIENDLLAIRNCSQLLKNGGRLIILVPAWQKLYNNMDRELGHFKRYTVPQISSVITTAGFDVVHQQYFNAAGMAGWFVSGSLLKKKMIPGNQLRFYNTMVPVFKTVDRLLLNSIGLSAICIGKKN